MNKHTLNEHELTVAFNNGLTIVLFHKFGTSVLNKAFTNIETLLKTLETTKAGRII